MTKTKNNPLTVSQAEALQWLLANGGVLPSSSWTTGSGRWTSSRALPPFTEKIPALRRVLCPAWTEWLEAGTVSTSHIRFKVLDASMSPGLASWIYCNGPVVRAGKGANHCLLSTQGLRGAVRKRYIQLITARPAIRYVVAITDLRAARHALRAKGLTPAATRWNVHGSVRGGKVTTTPNKGDTR